MADQETTADTTEDTAEQVQPAPVVKQSISDELLADITALAVKHGAHIYGNSIELGDGKSFAFNVNGAEESAE